MRHSYTLCSICRAKLDLPLVSAEQCKAASQQNMSDRSSEPASVRIADREQPYLANVPLLQDSYLFGVADWYSLVTTLVNSHWDTISSAYGPVAQTGDAINKAHVTSEQDTASDWMSWGWLQSFFQGLNAQHRQVLDDAYKQLPALLGAAGCRSASATQQPSYA